MISVWNSRTYYNQPSFTVWEAVLTDFFGFDGKGITEFNSELDVINYTALDMMGVREVIGGYQALAVFKDDKSYRVYQ